LLRQPRGQTPRRDAHPARCSRAAEPMRAFRHPPLPERRFSRMFDRVFAGSTGRLVRDPVSLR